VTKAGYVRVRVNHRDEYEHIVIVARALGHPLPLGAQIHHRDEDGTNNAPQNLIVCQDGAYHKLLHVRTEAYRATGDAAKRRCWLCREWDLAANLSRPWTHQPYHKRCAALNERAKPTYHHAPRPAQRLYK